MINDGPLNTVEEVKQDRWMEGSKIDKANVDSKDWEVDAVQFLIRIVV